MFLLNVNVNFKSITFFNVNVKKSENTKTCTCQLFHLFVLLMYLISSNLNSVLSTSLHLSTRPTLFISLSTKHPSSWVRYYHHSTPSSPSDPLLTHVKDKPPTNVRRHKCFGITPWCLVPFFETWLFLTNSHHSLCTSGG